jgi:hypothetical protein
MWSGPHRGVWEVKKDRLVHHHGCCCVKGRWVSVKENDDGRWSFDGVVQMKMRLSSGESDQGWEDLFIVVMDGNWAVRGGWPTTMVLIQYFDFGLREEATGWISVVGRWSGGGKLVLPLCKGSATRHGGVVTSTGEEMTPGRGKRENDISWVDMNLIERKNEENPRDWFSWYKWTVKI